MTPRSFWTIILKISGLYFSLQLFALFPQVFSIVFYRGDAGTIDILGFLTLDILLIGLYLFMIFGLFFRTNWIIAKLHLDKGFTEEKLEFNIHRSIVLRITIIVIGALIFIESLPALLKELFTYYQMVDVYNGFKHFQGTGWVIFYLVKVFFGYFMMTASRLIVNFIERKRKDKVQTDEQS